MLYPPLEYTTGLNGTDLSQHVSRKFLVIFRNGKKRAIDEAVIKITQDVRKLFAIAQVEMLFVEFFSRKRASNSVDKETGKMISNRTKKLKWKGKRSSSCSILVELIV